MWHFTIRKPTPYRFKIVKKNILCFLTEYNNKNTCMKNLDQSIRTLAYLTNYRQIGQILS